MAQGQTGRALMLLFIDAALWLGAIAGTIFVESTILKIVFGVIAGFVTGRIFILGHDACHQSFTPNRELNKVLGRIAFLPSLTPYSLWDVGHNVVHHGQTNLKGFDFVWAPLSKAEFDALPAWRKRLERLYRSGWGPVFYYLIEIWWRREYFPNAQNKPGDRPIFLKDNLLVTGFAIVWIACLIAGALATGQSIWVGLLTGFVLPFLFWNGMIGFVVYVHHTHPSVSWYDKKSEWLRAQPFVSTTVHLTFGFYWGALMHHIMEHTAHHVDMSVPLYRLQEAQNTLETLLPERIFIQKFSWEWYFDTARKCKLYDFENKAWLDFDGNKTADSVRVMLTPAPAGQTG
jgi:omega-6 fatty acid desaturase (delta-12 desaturase)